MNYLRIASRGTVGVRSLTLERYPSLRTVVIDSDEVDVSQLPADHEIATLTMPYNENKLDIIRLLWPNAVIEETLMAMLPETESKVIVHFHGNNRTSGDKNLEARVCL